MCNSALSAACGHKHPSQAGRACSWMNGPPAAVHCLLPFMTGFLRCCWFYVSTDSVCFSRFVICCPCFCLGRFAISHALRFRVLAIRCPDPAAGGVRPPAVGTTAQPYTAGRLPFIVTAVRKSTSEVPLRFIDALRFAPDIVRSQPRTASLLSGNSVLRADFFRRRLIPQQLPSVFQRFCAVLARGEPSAELPAARVRRTVADSASSCCGLQISVNLQSCPVRPSIAFSGVRLIRAHAVTGCPVGLEIH